MLRGNIFAGSVRASVKGETRICMLGGEQVADGTMAASPSAATPISSP